MTGRDDDLALEPDATAAETEPEAVEKPNGEGESVAAGEGESVVAGGGEGATDLGGADEGELPADHARVSSIIESLLFAADRPLTVADFKRLLVESNGARVAEILEELRLARAETGIQLISVAGGWQLRTHPQNGNWVAKLVAGRPQRLSRAMMETLAIVAYRQPITRPEVDEIRGVDCGPVLRTLLERGLVRAIGKKEEVGRPILYGTTPDFLKTFSMRDLTELPTLREFHELGAEERAKVDARAEPGAAAGGGAPDGAPLPVLTVSELPDADPAEEDSLIEELEAATQAAARVTRAPSEPSAEPGHDDGAAGDTEMLEAPSRAGEN